MAQLNTEKLIQLCEIVDDELHKRGMITARCLAAVTVTTEVLRKKGFACEPFPCAAQAHSKKLLDKIQLLKAEGRQGPASHDEAMRWREEGARQVMVLANQPEQEAREQNGRKIDKPLHGHIAFVVKDKASGWFVDPTSFQFRRTLKEHGWLMDVPRHFVQPLPALESFEEIRRLNALHKADVRKLDEVPDASVFMPCGGLLDYEYTRLDTLEAMAKKKKSKDWRKSDLNPEKFAAEIKAVAARWNP